MYPPSEESNPAGAQEHDQSDGAHEDDFDLILLEATPAAEVPEGALAHGLYWLKRGLIGIPIATMQDEGERLSKFKALAILSSDAISSVAFATEAILINLVVAGSVYLGILPGLVAAAALMIDYVLNVAVCVAAGMHNVVSLLPALQPYVVPLDLALVVVVTLLNLRGLRESGSIFAFPTYFFVVSASVLIIVGLVKDYVFLHQPVIGQFTPQVQAISRYLSLSYCVRLPQDARP
jgi:amino acid transporter